MPRIYCKWCDKEVTGRSDKLFCDTKCKSSYHHQLTKNTNKATLSTDKILHKNRTILLELMAKNTSRKTIDISELTNKNFKFDYMTGLYENNQGKRYHVVYDFAWMKFSNGKVLIIKRGK